MDTQAYQHAMDALMAKDYKAAERAFKIVLDSINETIGLANPGQYDIVQSYYGLTQVLNSNENGLLLCRDAASKEMLNGDVFLNLACAELESGNRKRAIDAIQQGMKIDADNVRLKHACSRLDCRKKCCLGFLPRDHKLNRFLGRLRRKPDQALTVHYLLFNK
jgi:tetratricopeptide (TPR) repeat protein